MAALNTSKQNRLYKGKIIFKWEDNPGLDHHCGICQKPFSKDSCKVTCVGKHAEPCYRYHQVLHFLGKSHECYACTTSDQMHYSRHKDIVVLVRRIKELDAAEVSRSSPFAKKTDGDSVVGNRRRRSNGDDWSETLSEIFKEDPPEALKRREKKRLRKSGHGAVKGLEVFTKHDIDFVDEAIHTPERNDFISFDETDEGYTMLHSIGELQEHQNPSACQLSPPTNASCNTPLKLNMSSRTGKSASPLLTITHKYTFFGKQAKRAPKDISGLFGSLNPDIFHRLGVEIVGQHGSKRKELFTRLLQAINNDIEIIEQEEREAELRKLAFYRWAGRTGALAMEEAHENYDWRTGILKKNDYSFPAPKSPLPFQSNDIDHCEHNRLNNSINATTPVKIQHEQTSAEQVFRSINAQRDSSDPDAKNGPVILRIIPPTFRHRPIDTPPRNSTPSKIKAKPKAIKKRQSARAQQILQVMLEEDRHPRQKEEVVLKQAGVGKQKQAAQRDDDVSLADDEEAFAEEDLQFLLKMKNLRK